LRVTQENEVRGLPADASTEAEKIATWSLSEEADFQSIDQIQICKNTSGFATVTSKLSGLFTEEIEV
jgi:hypothetical protein